MRRIFVAILLLVGVLGGHAAHACDSDEIDVLGDGTNCQTAKFTLTTTEIADGGKFQFYISAKGTFYVDCGAGGALSGTGASGKTITRSNTTGATYTCTYTGNTEAKTIRFGGIAGTAANKPYSTANTAAASVIRFNVTPTLVASVSGSLGAIFPTRNATYTPKFRETFSGCTNLTEIPSTLFSNVTGSVTYQFYRTFYGCTSLESIPSGLFSGISGTKTYLFYQTFYNCSGLTGYIPAGMFDKITTYSSNMMSSMFYGTGLDTTCLGTTVKYITGFEGYWSSKVSCTEPFVIPVALDDQSATTVSVPTTVYLKYGTGWYSDLNATTPISALATNPTKTDYDFDGYWTATNGAGTQIIDADGGFITTDAAMKISKITDASKTIYANWTQDYTVTYSCGDGTGTPPANGTATSRKTFTPEMGIVSCHNDDYMFSGWVVSGTSDIKTNAFTWNYTENKTFTAQYTIPVKFTITTVNMAASTEFRFSMASVKGTFYVDWGDGVVQTINRDSATNITVHSHQYVSAGVKTIRFGGVATAYNRPSYGSTDRYAVIKFGDSSSSASPLTRGLIARVSGDISQVFPYPIQGATSGYGPYFYKTFEFCDQLTDIAGTLFQGYTVGVTNMFNNTFQGCSNLTSIPTGLFSNISSVVSGANGLFTRTFWGCTGLKTIPSGVFGNTPVVRYMFDQTFSGCTGLTSIPSDLFSGIYGEPAQSMFSSTFYGCTGLTGAIPENLFSGISGPGASGMFDSTFGGCSNLSGYVPKGLFENITSTGSGGVSRTFSNTNLYTECPCGTKPAETGWGATVVDGRAVCEVGTKDNEHWNNGICTTDCGLGFSKLKSSTGLEYPILSATTTDHNINLSVGNGVCHVPLANGAANNNINVSFGGATYHATVPDEIVPTGFTGQPAPVEPD